MHGIYCQTENNIGDYNSGGIHVPQVVSMCHMIKKLHRNYRGHKLLMDYLQIDKKHSLAQ